MITAIHNGKLILEDGICEGKCLYIEDGKILAITEKKLDAQVEIDAKGSYVSPGFIDIHTHGGAGYDFLDNTKEAYEAISVFYAKHGATALVPTITSSTTQGMNDAIDVFESLGKTEGATLLGIHFEGPYFSPAQKGAQEERFLRSFDKDEYQPMLDRTDCILRWTGAPELDGAEEFAKALQKKSVLPCIGHSDAESTVAHKAFENGFSHVTHLYSCTSMVHRKNAFRYAGIVEEAYLNDDMTVEIIADGIHLPADLLRLVYKIKGADRIALITDSMRGAGMPDGESVIGSLEDGLHVIIEDGVAKLPDRSAFAGSVATCDRLVRNMITMAGVPLADAVKMMATTPARILGLEKKGILKEGYDADITIFDQNITIERTIVGGKTVYQNA